MPWVISTLYGRRFTGPLGDVLVPLNVPTEVPQWVYDLIIQDEFGVTPYVPGQPITVPEVFDPLPKHVVPEEFYDPHFYDAEGGVVSDDTFGGLPV
jgi:hypothetical protein